MVRVPVRPQAGGAQRHYINPWERGRPAGYAGWLRCICKATPDRLNAPKARYLASSAANIVRGVAGPGASLLLRLSSSLRALAFAFRMPGIAALSASRVGG